MPSIPSFEIPLAGNFPAHRSDFRAGKSGSKDDTIIGSPPRPRTGWGRPAAGVLETTPGTARRGHREGSLLTPKKRQAQKQTQKQTRKRAGKRSNRARTLRWVGLIGIAVILVVGAFLLSQRADEAKPGEHVRIMGVYHLTGTNAAPAYNSVPPTSGPHLPQIARWGVHSEAIPDEMQVHNLEDGGVMVQYNGLVTDETISRLEQVVRDYGKHVTLAPYPDMDSPIALTAWGRIDKLDTFDRDRILRFIDTYEGTDHHRG